MEMKQSEMNIGPGANPGGVDEGASSAKTEADIGDWLGNGYFQGLSTEKQSSLEQLHQATNWGLTIITTAVLVAIVRNSFPDHASVVLLSITLVAGWHYCVRALKGYINVMRYLLVQSGVIDYKLGNLPLEQATLRIETYHRDWRLPISRGEVFLKGIVELGFGYLLIVNLAALAYAFVQLPHPGSTILVGIAAAAAIAMETVIFLRSPYMRAAPHPYAQSVR